MYTRRREKMGELMDQPGLQLEKPSNAPTAAECILIAVYLYSILFYCPRRVALRVTDFYDEPLEIL